VVSPPTGPYKNAGNYTPPQVTPSGSMPNITPLGMASFPQTRPSDGDHRRRAEAELAAMPEVQQGYDLLAGLEEEYRQAPSRPENVLNLAEAYARQGHFNARTRRIFMEALQYVPANATMQRALSVSFLVQRVVEQIGKGAEDADSLTDAFIEENMNAFERLAERHPNSADVLKVLGDLELLGGKGHDAIAHYEQTIRLGWKEPGSIGQTCLMAVHRRSFSEDVLLHVAMLLEDIGAYRDAVAVTQAVIRRATAEAYLLNLYVRQLERASRVESDPTAASEMRMELAQTLQKLGRQDEALILLREFLPGTLGVPKLVKWIARLLIRAKDYRTAFEHLQNIPLDDEAKHLLNDITVALEQAGDLDTAVYLLKYINTNDQAFKEALELQERTIAMESEVEHAELCLKNERHDEAFKKFLSLLQAGYEPADLIHSRIDEMLGKIPISSYFGLVMLGRLCVQKERYSQAVNYLKRVLQVYPDEPEAMELMRRSYDGLLSRNPNQPDLRYKSARLYKKMGQLDKAMAEFEQCLRHEQLRERVTRDMAACHVERRQHDQALALYQKVRIEQEDCEPLYALADIFKDRDPRRALEALSLVRRCNPQYRDILQKIAALEERLRKTDGKLIEDPKMKELIGNLAVGRYRYIGKIGSGGMGIVHKVFDMKNNMVVAMKILREGLANSGKAIDRFYREARIAAKLNHRNIVNIYDYSINNVHGHSYITMEFVDGPSLRDIIEKKFATKTEVDLDDICEALYYMAQLCDALYATHKAGIIHRDIKPDNILVNSEGIVKVTDFGIVHVEEATFTPTGAMVGTPRYMSPEQIQGRKLDGRSDIYAAGIILYELLCGNPPFISGDISYQHIHMTPTSPKDLCPLVPDDVNSIVLKCLAKVTEERYDDGLLLRQDVEQALERLNDARQTMPSHGHGGTSFVNDDLPSGPAANMEL